MVKLQIVESAVGSYVGIYDATANAVRASAIARVPLVCPLTDEATIAVRAGRKIGRVL